MTKDRRLGRGLAALLGTPADEEGGGVMTEQMPEAKSSVATSRPSSAGSSATSRTETISKLHSDAMQVEAKTVSVPAKSTPIETNPTATAMQQPKPDGTDRTPIYSMELKVDQIETNPFQPRRQFNVEEIASLAESIKTHKQIQPILVRRVGDGYQLISGERRLRATIHAGLKTIRAEVRDADDKLVSELAIIENLQRKDLNAIEKAFSFRRYLDEHRCTQDELAKRLSLDRSTIANAMRLLDLPKPIIELISAGQLTGGHCKSILSLGSEVHQLEVARVAALEGWSVRAVEKRVGEIIRNEDGEDGGLATAVTRNSFKTKMKDDQLEALEQQMKMGLGTKIEINRTSRGRGRIVVHFTSLEEFDRLHSMFSGKNS